MTRTALLEVTSTQIAENVLHVPTAVLAVLTCIHAHNADLNSTSTRDFVWKGVEMDSSLI